MRARKCCQHWSMPGCYWSHGLCWQRGLCAYLQPAGDSRRPNAGGDGHGTVVNLIYMRLSHAGSQESLNRKGA